MDVPPPPEPQPLRRLPYPAYVKLLALVTAVAFVFALSRVPHAVRSGIDAERGQRDLAAGRYHQAALALRRVLQAYPNAKDVRIDYADACLKDGNLLQFGETMEWLQGKEVSKEQNERVDAMVAEADRQVEAINAAEGGKK